MLSREPRGKERELRERERECSRIKERRVAVIREETQTLPSINQKSCILSSLGVVVQYRYARLNLFSWLQGRKNLQISRTMRFILPFIFSLYYE